MPNGSGPLVIDGGSGAPPAIDERAPSQPGRGRLIIDGELIEVDIVRVPPELADVPIGERSEADVALIRQIAEEMLAAVIETGGDGGVSPVAIRYTDDGAVFVGLLIDPETGLSIEVPVEEVALLTGGGLVLLVGGMQSDGSTDVMFDGILRLGVGGWIAILASGLAAEAEGSVVVMSEPRLLGSFQLDRSGAVAVQVRIPGDLPVGDHTAVVAVGEDAASIGFSVVGDSTLPVTGSRGVIPPVAILVVAVGGFLAILRRRPELVIADAARS